MVTFLLLASETRVGPDQRARIAGIVGDVEEDGPLAAELQSVRAQLSALSAYLRDAA